MANTVEHIKAALAEVGYPDALVVDLPEDQGGPTVHIPADMDGKMVWKAFRVVSGTTRPCFECWDMGLGEECEH